MSSVQLAGNLSASAILHQVLLDSVASFPDALGNAGLTPRLETFKKDYPEQLPRFEATRLASQDRLAIARDLSRSLLPYLVWQDGGLATPLDKYLETPAAPLTLQTSQGTGQPDWQLGFDYQDLHWPVSEFEPLGELLVQRHTVTPSVAQALNWIAQQTNDRGVLDLTGRKIVMFGAGAEMAPTHWFLQAGADILWLDMAPPRADWQSLAGNLTWPTSNVDLHTQPAETLATILEFSNGEPIDLGLFAYAPGQARELRLAGTMNAIVNALPTEVIGSVTILVSPSTPTALGPQDLAAMQDRLANRPAWEAALASVGLLGKAGAMQVGDAATTRTVVDIQGTSYQAAQYLAKIMMAECWADHGNPLQDESKPLRVSANTAAITQTRSLQHPIFAAAFDGASAFGVETLTPEQSQTLNGMLAVRDWLYPEPPVPGELRVHGGIHTLPYPLGKALIWAAAIGFARSPGLIAGLLGK